MARATIAAAGAGVLIAAAVLSTSAGATTPTGIALPYGATGWRYLNAGMTPAGLNGPLSLDGTEDSTFAQPGFDDSAYLPGQGSFGDGAAGAGVAPGPAVPVVTEWPTSTDLLLRHHFTLPTDGTGLGLSGTVDNDADIYLNGHLEGTVHGGNNDPAVITNTSFPNLDTDANRGGDNVLAIRARDFGGSDYFDIQVTCATCNAPLPTQTDAVANFATNGNPAPGYSPAAAGYPTQGAWSYVEAPSAATTTTSGTTYALSTDTTGWTPLNDLDSSCVTGAFTWHNYDEGCLGGGGVVTPVTTRTQLAPSAFLDPGFVGMTLNSTQWPGVAWTNSSSQAQTVSVAGAVQPGDEAVGYTRQWALVDATTTGAATIVTSGSVSNNGVTGSGGAPINESSLTVPAGHQLILFVGPDTGGSYQYDTTEVQLQVNPPTSPGPTPPAGPTNVIATGGDTQLALTWSDSDPSVTGYNVYVGTTSGAEATTPDNGSTLVTTTSYTIHNLTPNTTYYATVQAVNAAAATSTPVEASAATVPGTPGTASATGGGKSKTLTVTWAENVNNGGVAFSSHEVHEYVYKTPKGHGGTATYTEVTGSPFSTTGTATSYAATGLSVKQSYSFKVATCNPSGCSALPALYSTPMAG